MGGVSLDQCSACGGVWVGQHNFEQLAGDRAERGEVLAALPGQGPTGAAAGGGPLPGLSPVRKLMNRLNYARISGVVLDVCKEHGLWFDRDELRQVLEFIEGGGLEQSHLRQVQEENDPPHGHAQLPPGAWGEMQAHGSARGAPCISSLRFR